jgi:lipopolysaccharide export system protein LptA
MVFASRSPRLYSLGLMAISVASLVGMLASPTAPGSAAQPPTAAPGQPITLRSDVQEANSVTGVITARGNVQITYPARQIQATAVQAQYYTRERRIVLSGNVYVLQQGNSMRGETITYLIDQGRFVALPENGQQVESIYLVQDSPTPSPSPSAEIPPFNPRSGSNAPASSPSPSGSR